jgi:membrane-bound lytic murein transglycosylase B
MAQFMPSSFNKYAVDFDGDGHVDLHANAADVIGSVANYLAEFGWKRGLPARFDVRPPTDTSERAALLAPDIVPTFTAGEMVQRGAWLPERRSPSTACSPSSSCRTATRRRPTSPARPTSTR